MTTLKAIIVDDERLARLNLRKLLLPHPEIKIVGEAGSCASAVDFINLNNPQLIFLDIQLGGETGFDLCEVGDSKDGWDANVGSRVLYQLCGALLASQGKIEYK